MKCKKLIKCVMKIILILFPLICFAQNDSILIPQRDCVINQFIENEKDLSIYTQMYFGNLIDTYELVDIRNIQGTLYEKYKYHNKKFLTTKTKNSLSVEFKGTKQLIKFNSDFEIKLLGINFYEKYDEFFFNIKGEGPCNVYFSVCFSKKQKDTWLYQYFIWDK